MLAIMAQAPRRAQGRDGACRFAPVTQHAAWCVGPKAKAGGARRRTARCAAGSASGRRSLLRSPRAGPCRGSGTAGRALVLERAESIRAAPACRGGGGLRKIESRHRRSPPRVPHTSRSRARRYRAMIPRSCEISRIAVFSSAAKPFSSVEHLRLDRHVERGRRLVGDQQASDCRPPPSRSSRAGAFRRRTGGDRRRRALPDAECRRAAASRAPSRAARPRLIGSCSMIASPIWSPMVITGFSELIGSWKIIAMSRPRISGMSLRGSVSRFTPSNRMRPLEIRPGGSGISRRMDKRRHRSCPSPNSPTMPTATARRRSRS